MSPYTAPKLKRDLPGILKLLLCCVSLISCANDPVTAADVNWINPSGGNFVTGSNWELGTPPGPSDAAVFSLGLSYSVHTTANLTTQRLFIQNDEVDFNLNGRTYELPSAADSGSVTIGSTTSVARITLRNGVMTARNVELGVGTSSAGAATISPAATWIVSRVYSVGRDGSGTLTVESGGRISLTNAEFSNPGTGVLEIGAGTSGTAYARISGAGAIVTNNASSIVGASIGHGSVMVEDGATVSDHFCAIGIDGGSGDVTIKGTGSTWSSYARFVGPFGQFGVTGSASLTISDGGRAISTAPLPTCDAIGARAGGTAQVLVTGAGSEYLLNGGLCVGEAGAGLLRVEGGGKVSAHSVSVGNGAGDTGILRITGASSALIANNVLIGPGGGVGTGGQYWDAASFYPLVFIHSCDKYWGRS